MRRSFDDSEHWYIAGVIVRCSRGAYALQVDVGDETEPMLEHWAASNVEAAKAWIRSHAKGPVHWSENALNPGDEVLAYVLRKHYLVRLEV